MKKIDTRIKLGASDLWVSPLGIGIWSWGARFFWGYGTNYQEKDLKEAFITILQAGINFIDTAEVYGSGMSEKILGKFSSTIEEELIIATKFFPFPWRIDRQSTQRAISKSLKRLRRSHVGLYQFHMPFPPYSIEYWMKKLAPLYHEGYTKALGVSNFDLHQTQLARQTLENKGVPLVSNQLRYSLLDRGIEKNGLMEYCLENNIAIIAYSPLAMGMLTGKYSGDSPPGGIRRSSYGYNPDFLFKISPLLDLMQEIGQGRGGKKLSQVAINWTIAKGAIPIPGAKNSQQVIENIGALNWQLTPEEVSALDQESDRILDYRL